MQDTEFVSREAWLAARKALLAEEKAFTRQRDHLSAQRRRLPMVLIDKDYLFDTNEGRKSLADLFGSNGQLAVYHFMFGETWQEGCPSCSFWADNYDRLDVHLAARNTTLLAISSAPLETLNAYKKRMGWSFEWASTGGNDFGVDFGVTFPGKEDRTGYGYNYKPGSVHGEELPGLSIFLKLEDGRIGHSYSTYGRGLDILNMAYNILDMTPLGRQEDGLPYAQAWVRRHDMYGTGN